MKALKFKLNLQVKLILAFALISFLVSGATAFGLYTTMKRQNLENFRRRVLNAVAIAALQQNGDEFEQISSADDPLYEKLRLQDLRIKNTDADFIYVYTMRKDAQGIYFVVDGNELDAEGFSAYGDRYLEPSPTLVNNFDPMNQPMAEPEIYSDEFGSFISAYAPILTTDGRKVGVIGLDISADTILGRQRQLLLLSIGVTAIATLIGILIGAVTGRILTRPIRELSETTRKIASGDLAVRSTIASGDEIESLSQSLNNMADEIGNLLAGLEDRISRRTHELTTANDQMKRRAVQFEAITEVARVVADIQDLEELLPNITEVISEKFGHYHTGVFLLDEAGEYAVLRAANSEGGRKMLARRHRLPVGQTGIVGYVTATGNPRIALDVGADSIFFDNPDLPGTRSEIALPLRVSGKLIGALDVQSLEENAFNQDDVSALTTLADQVSIAIQNTRTLDQARKSLAEAQSTYGETIQEAWKVLRPQSLGLGIQLKDAALKTLNEPIRDETIKNAIETGETAASAGHREASLAIPIRLRGQVIGAMRLKNNGENPWTEDEVDIAEAVAERLSLAIETASLLTTTRQKAEIERVTTDVTSKISSSSHFDTILQTAAQELSKALGGSEVLVQIEPQALKLGMPEQ